MFAVSRALLRTVPRQVRSYGGKDHPTLAPPHMNELPVPSGSWQALHDARQRKYNLTLALGIGFFCFSVACAKSSGYLFFNFSPPKSID